MRTIAILLFLTSAAWSAQQEVSRNFDKTVPLGAGQRLSIEHQFGDVTVRGGPQKDVVIHAVIRSASSEQAEAERMLNEIQIQVDQTAAGVSVKTRYPDQGRMGRRNRSFSVSYTITAPQNASLEIQNSFGPVVIGDMMSGTRVRNSHGRLEFRGGKGTQILENSFGALEVAGNQGDVTANNGNGSVRVADVSGVVNIRSSFGGVVVERAGGNVVVTNGNGGIQVTDAGGEANLTGSFGTMTVNGAAKGLTATNQNGTVRASRIGGWAKISNTFGTIDLREVNGPVDLQNSNGTIRALGVKGMAKANTTFGGIHLSDVGGPVEATNANGSIVVVVAPGTGCRPVTLRSTFGPIKLGIPEPANYNVHASTSFGRIHSDYPLTVSGKIDTDSIDGKIGNGGCELRITNANGGISIVKNLN